MNKEKRTVIIAGAGQMGRAAAELLNPNEVEFLGFADNDNDKWTVASGELPDISAFPPVFSMETAVNLEPDEIIVSIMGDERARQIKEQLRVCRFYGNITFLKDIYGLFDIRSRCIHNIAERIIETVEGDIAELGVYKGNTAWPLNKLFPDRKLYLFDTFEGFDNRDEDAAERREDFSDTSVDFVMDRMSHPENCVIRKGYFPETAEGLDNLTFALVSIDPDIYEPTLAGLKYFWPRMNEGGVIVVHDYDNKQFDGVKKAVDEYDKIQIDAGNKPLKIVPLGDLHGSCVIIK